MLIVDLSIRWTVVLRLSTTVYAEAYTYTNDNTMVDNGDTNGLWSQELYLWTALISQ